MGNACAIPALIRTKPSYLKDLWGTRRNVQRGDLCIFLLQEGWTVSGWAILSPVFAHGGGHGGNDRIGHAFLIELVEFAGR